MIPMNDIFYRLTVIFLSVADFFSVCINPLPTRKLLDSSKQKDFAENNFQLHKNGRKFSKRVENTVEKIACL